MAHYKNLGVTVTRVMTDNDSCYKAFAFRDACWDLGLKHICTKPFTPKTNGKAARFIQTALLWIDDSISHGSRNGLCGFLDLHAASESLGQEIAGSCKPDAQAFRKCRRTGAQRRSRA